MIFQSDYQIKKFANLPNIKTINYLDKINGTTIDTTPESRKKIIVILLQQMATKMISLLVIPY
jgi:hypothetical protein